MASLSQTSGVRDEKCMLPSPEVYCSRGLHRTATDFSVGGKEVEK